MSKGGITPEAAQPLLSRSRTASTHSNHSTRSNALGRTSRSRSRSGSIARSDSTRTRPASITLGRSSAAKAGGRPVEAYHVIDEAQIPRKYLITVRGSSLFRAYSRLKLIRSLSVGRLLGSSSPFTSSSGLYFSPGYISSTTSSINLNATTSSTSRLTAPS